MKNSIKLIMLLLTGVLAGSCDLERLPYSEVTNESLNAGNASTITLGHYTKLKEEYYYKTLHYTFEYGGDNISLSSTTSDELYYLYKYQRQSDNYYPARVWKFTYQNIVSINGLIEMLNEGETEELDQLLGENYYLRAMLYFNICNLFGRPYVQNPETNLGVPLKLTSDITEFPLRATVKEVYDQVVKDLEKAASLMGSKKANIYASKEVAYALLSRVYLYMQNWEKARECADLVINSGRYTLLEGAAYEKYPRYVPEENSETIFAIRMMKDTDFKEYNMDRYSVGSMYAKIDNVGWGEMYPSWPYLQLLRQNESDLRHAFIVEQYQEEDFEWMIYVLDDESNKAYNFVTNRVELQDGEYVITENPDLYTSNKVQEEIVDGKKVYYVTRKDTGKKYEVHIERALDDNEGFPKRYIYKCSLQEEQTQLWSPVILRLAEMYLNRAEANYHLGKPEQAIDDVNVIRKRAQIPLRDMKDLPSGTTVLDWVLEERRLELAFEAQRKLDIFRNGQTLNRRYPGTHLSGSLSTVRTTVSPTDNVVVEFIPQRELDAYPVELVQNP